ncbi:MAG: type II toxin-antitoxin system VapC family toxin [Opitutaceae bacterium]|nr:type II toxin-antitoxin system VapC family toxin [Opitutaceae bacterium]
MTYWDTSYLAKLYVHEAGAEQVQQTFAHQGGFVCADHGRLELMTAFKRHQREGLLTAAQLKMLWSRHEQDLEEGLIRYLPLPATLVDQACRIVAQLPPAVFLRAADALHLACASDAGLKEIYSHDRHLLAAAPHFGLKGLDIISPKSK